LLGLALANSLYRGLKEELAGLSLAEDSLKKALEEVKYVEAKYVFKS
jgi:hypothetical protein